MKCDLTDLDLRAKLLVYQPTIIYLDARLTPTEWLRFEFSMQTTSFEEIFNVMCHFLTCLKVGLLQGRAISFELIHAQYSENLSIHLKYMKVNSTEFASQWTHTTASQEPLNNFKPIDTVHCNQNTLWLYRTAVHVSNIGT